MSTEIWPWHCRHWGQWAKTSALVMFHATARDMYRLTTDMNDPLAKRVCDAGDMHRLTTPMNDYLAKRGFCIFWPRFIMYVSTSIGGLWRSVSPCSTWPGHWRHKSSEMEVTFIDLT